jgi:hypothetical protein
VSRKFGKFGQSPGWPKSSEPSIPGFFAKRAEGHDFDPAGPLFPVWDIFGAISKANRDFFGLASGLHQNHIPIIYS